MIRLIFLKGNNSMAVYKKLQWFFISILLLQTLTIYPFIHGKNSGQPLTIQELNDSAYTIAIDHTPKVKLFYTPISFLSFILISLVICPSIKLFLHSTTSLIKQKEKLLPVIYQSAYFIYSTSIKK
ncbi:hypothetical protein [Falsibacillus albus]|uniref:Uncharacterized protein n=1 Tax=Falsibacillus albus TaxID=2478915 RepID=A0A3L7JZ01_9BACI|nr:hypothetical protein [Falsibacillus albus]RLQ95545.1 hypothetical protein D9X91_10985 [Falsibacillus albus]